MTELFIAVLATLTLASVAYTVWEVVKEQRFKREVNRRIKEIGK
jgi:hypothetical protein